MAAGGEERARRRGRARREHFAIRARTRLGRHRGGARRALAPRAVRRGPGQHGPSAVSLGVGRARVPGGFRRRRGFRRRGFLRGFRRRRAETDAFRGGCRGGGCPRHRRSRWRRRRGRDPRPHRVRDAFAAAAAARGVPGARHRVHAEEREKRGRRGRLRIPRPERARGSVRVSAAGEAPPRRVARGGGTRVVREARRRRAPRGRREAVRVRPRERRARGGRTERGERRGRRRYERERESPNRESPKLPKSPNNRICTELRHIGRCLGAPFRRSVRAVRRRRLVRRRRTRRRARDVYPRPASNGDASVATNSARAFRYPSRSGSRRAGGVRRARTRHSALLQFRGPRGRLRAIRRGNGRKGGRARGRFSRKRLRGRLGRARRLRRQTQTRARDPAERRGGRGVAPVLPERLLRGSRQRHAVLARRDPGGNARFRRFF